MGRCALQVFKRADRAPWGRYRIQYVFRCPNVKCRNQVVEPSFRAAAEIIDRELLGQRIGDRSKPLAEKILARIRAGIERYWAPLLVPVEGRDGKQASPVSDPLRTMTTPNETGLLVPTGGTSRTDATTTDQPMPTRTTRENDGLAVPPFIAELRGGGSTHRPVTEPLATVTASGTHHGLVMAFYGRGGTKPADEALSTVTAVERHALLASQHPTIDVDDVLFRMLEPREIASAMDFPDSYRILGNRREQVRQSGNAVTPCAARDLVGVVAESLG